jgi:hypothetical protein
MSEEEKAAAAKMIMPGPGPIPPYFDRDKELAIELLRMALNLLQSSKIMPYDDSHNPVKKS